MKVMSAIERCRTAALGGHVARYENEKCAHTIIAYNSCRNRHCPKSQGAAAREWLAAREADLLPVPVPYFHVVFTLPGRHRRHRLPEQGRDLRHPVHGFGRDHDHHRGRSQAPRRPHRHHLGASHLGLGVDPEPSLRIPGIITSLIFNEQGKLVLRAAPLKN
jgi:Transposase zinc-binding domain